MGDKRSGLGAVVSEAMDQGEPLLDEADQLDLLGDDPERGSPVGGSVFAQGKGGSPVVRQAGRPKGAQNLTTKRMRDYLLANYRHPLLGIFDVASTTPDQIAQLFLPRDENGEVVKRWVHVKDGVGYWETPALSKDDIKEAFQFWRQCAFEAAEYVATKQPRQLVAEVTLPPIFQQFTAPQGAADGGVIDATFGLPKNPEETMIWPDDPPEVPQEEVPQDGQSVANTTGSEPSGD